MNSAYQLRVPTALRSNVKMHLIFINFSILQFGLSLFLKSDNDKSHKNVDKEERENNEEDNVEN
jgi:hypothetical protein